VSAQYAKIANTSSADLRSVQIDVEYRHSVRSKLGRQHFGRQGESNLQSAICNLKSLER
jgi:hypothetical protein